MTILVAPLNWGLGHATRCIPLIQRFLDEGHRVVIGGDGESGMLLRKHFPQLSFLPLAPLQLRYSKGHSQVWAMMRALPRIIASSIHDHMMLRTYMQRESFDLIISDNRFGLYLGQQPKANSQQPKTVYMTHQLFIRLPRGWRWLEPLAHTLHARIYNRYNEVWVPDYADPARCLSGELSHSPKLIANSQKPIKYIGPLSRFAKADKLQETATTKEKYDVVAVLSGLEPQRSQLEQELIRRYREAEEKVLIVQGLIRRPRTTVRHGNLTIVPHLTDTEMREALLHAHHIIARSGYSTLMDLDALGVMDRAELSPTPGQPEQEYLAHAIDAATYPCRDGRNA